MKQTPKTFKELFANTGIEPTTDESGNVHYNFKATLKEEPKQDLEKEMFELEQELDIPSHLRWHNSKPKKETTLEEAAERFRSKNPGTMQGGNNTKILNAFIAGAKWKQEQDKNKYSEEDIAKAFDEGVAYETQGKLIRGKEWIKTHKKEWFEQFKNK